MAHGNYDCCACCDGYAGSGTSAKEEMCELCAYTLTKLTGVRIMTGRGLIQWVKSSEPSRVREVLERAGFRYCGYPNDVDEAVRDVLGAEG